jgi:ribulose-phosphate 3-epimerase
MAVVCPTVMGASSKEYREAIERVADFAERIHIDFSDGVFAPTKLESIDDAWWPIGLMVDFHIMYQRPLDYIESVLLHQPNLAIIHAEADGVNEFLRELDGLGINKGLALLKDTPVDVIKPNLELIDHVLIFSGDLGYYGGRVNFDLLGKVREVQQLNPAMEIGWDGGINAETIKRLADGGVDVLNVGGAIQKSEDPEKAYDILCENIQS